MNAHKRIAYVTFNESGNAKRYAYKCPHSVSIGDIAVVRVGGIEKLTTVREIGYDDPVATKTILTIIDRSDVLREERRRLRLNEILNELTTIEVELRKQDRFAALARRSPRARKLVNEMKRLSK